MRVRPTLVLIGVCLLQLSLAALPKLELRPNNDICQYFKDGTVLRKPGYCDRTIKCQNGISMPDTNCKTTEIWSLSKKKCGTTSDSYCAAPCAKSSPRYVSDPKNCEGWYECDGTKKIRSGYCANQMWFDQGTQLCMYPSQTNCLVKYSFCDVVPTGVSIPDYYNCHQYVQCNDKGNEEVFTCPLGQYFDIASGECIRNSLVNCYKHPVPEDACGTTKLPIRDRFVSDRATCRGYFFCKNQYAYLPDPEPAWGQCPLGFFFYEAMQACLPVSQVSCSQDRCDGIVEGLTLSERFGCQHYLTCRNNATMDEFQCPAGQYFDAQMRRCTETYQRYSVCS